MIMRKSICIIMLACVIGILVACNNNEAEEAEDEELVMLEVDFIVPESAEVGETVELKAEVTYGNEAVTDADEVLFEVWETSNEDDSEKIDGENNGDGTYSI